MASVDLDGIPLFAELTAPQRTQVASLARDLRWEPGDVALHEGEFAFDFYAIRDGAAEVRHEGERLAVLGAGDFFGEIGAVGRSRRRTATVVVTAPTLAVAISGSDMRRLSEDIPALREALGRAAAARGGAETLG